MVVFAENDVFAAREWTEFSGDGFPGFAAHYHHVDVVGVVSGSGDFFEILELVFEMPRKFIVLADAEILVGGDYNI